MKNKNESPWSGLVKVLHIQHLSKNGDILWEDYNLKNIFHTEGEAFVLNSVFSGGNNPNTFIPNNYYFGLDGRISPNAGDSMADILGEPVTNGYFRQTISSEGQFSVSEVEGVNQANGPIIQFSASGGSWGPVRQLFFTNATGLSGDLIATVALSSEITLSDGESVNMRMGLSLRDCPPAP
mgnify:FL=1|jgi:hypothetical protein